MRVFKAINNKLVIKKSNIFLIKKKTLYILISFLFCSFCYFDLFINAENIGNVRVYCDVLLYFLFVILLNINVNSSPYRGEYGLITKDKKCS